MNKKLAIVVICLMAIALISGCTTFNKTTCKSEFQIRTANLDGSNTKLLISDSYREMTHVRVSPNGQWITFSRSNNILANGCAKHGSSAGLNYLKTEVLISRIDGSDIRVLIPSNENEINVNSYWVNDKELLFLTANIQKTEIKRIILDNNMNIKEIKTLNIPTTFNPVDPHQVGNLIVFPSLDSKTKIMSIWIMNSDGSNLQPLTAPEPDEENLVNDPKLSPDTKNVAYMRYVKDRGTWHTHVVDVETGEDIDLSEQHIPEGYFASDGIPEWSSDGELLLFWYADYQQIKNNNLYTMRPDGSERKKIPLPSINAGYYISGGSFFPGSGSGDDAKIIYNAERIVG